MGRGIIKSGGDDGLYDVELTLHKDRVNDTIAIINNQIAVLTTKINAMEEGNEKELEKLKRASYRKRKDYLNDNMPEDPTVSAWCGDLTEDLSGNVGTIEIPGERGIVQIQPGHESNAAYNTERDGQLQPAIANTPAGTFYNLAMLPGWQKWKPTYRHGIISNIDTDNDTCDVALDIVESSQQGLTINQESKLVGIPIEYMSCNASAFEDGDSVLVKFEGQEWGGAKVVGFKDNPKVCEFYIDITVNDFIPAYYKTIKLIDNDGMVHIKDSSIEEPSKVGPFSNVAFPAKVYLYMVGNAPIITDDTGMLFSYFTENPVKEFTVRVETWQEGATIAVNGIVLGNGDQQKFSWNFTSKVWSPVSGGVDKNTTKFMASKTNPSSTGYNQACKKEVVNAYEGTRILLTGEGEGNPQTMGEIYDYLMSAKKVSNSFYHCDLYKPYYGLLENEPIYGPPFETELEEYYRIAAWRVPYLLADDETIAKPKDPINFTALRTGSLMVKKTVVPHCHCEWVIEEKTWEGNPEDIKYNPYPNNAPTAYLIAAIMKIELGSPYYDTPHNCYGTSGWYWCEDNLECYTEYKTKIGNVVVPQMGIMTDSSGHNAVFDLATLNVDYTGLSASCGYFDPETGDWIVICINDMPLNAGAIRYEFKMLPTPEHRI